MYVDLNNRIGPEKTKDAAIAAGIPKNTPDLGSNLVNVLGTASVHPIDLATAYATFAAQGVHRPWHVINSITAVEGDRPVYDVPEKDTKARGSSTRTRSPTSPTPCRPWSRRGPASTRRC